MSTTSITCTNTSGTSCDGTEVSYATNAASGSTVTVSITYTHEWLTPIGSLCTIAGGSSCVGDTISLQRSASMVRE